jgi:hypothetical protein
LSATQRLKSHLAAVPGMCHTQLHDLAQELRSEHVLEIIEGNEILLRPGLLTANEHATLARDLPQLLDLLVSLPHRLFDGDAAAMCDALGIGGAGRSAIVATWSDEALVMGRADLIKQNGSFNLVEFNVHSSVGGLENADLTRALLRQPLFGEFADAEGLQFTDTIDKLAAGLRRAAAARGVRGRPTVAVMDWHTTYPTFERSLGRIATLLSARGLDAIPCHVGQATFRDDQLWVGARPIDLLYRIFLIEDLIEGDEPLRPILAAQAAGNLILVMSFAAELAGNKGALALLSEAARNGTFTDPESALVERCVPWTRIVRAGQTERAGERVVLADLAISRRSELVLKPIVGHGGAGVLPGWTTGEDDWRAALEDAMCGPVSHVLQERVRPTPEWMPRLSAGAVGFEATALNWGVFIVDGDFAGCIIRGASASGNPIINVSGGAGAGCCLHAIGSVRSRQLAASRTSNRRDPPNALPEMRTCSTERGPETWG